MMKEILNRKAKVIAWNYVFKALTKLPLNDEKVFFESFLGKSYSDNPKAIYENMIDTHNFKYVWSTQNKKEIIGNAKQVKRLGITYFYHIATAKYLVVNSRMPIGFQKRKGQVYVQTWHGTPLKRLGHDIKKYTMPNTDKEQYLKEFDRDVANWDYLISPNQYSSEHLKSAFKFDKEIIEMGYPRNDFLTNYSEYNVKVIKNRYNLNVNDKVLLYAPTYRDNKYDKNKKYTQQIRLDLALLQKKCPEWKIIIRTHYLVGKEIDLTKYKNVIIPESDVDINELMIVADCLMTDYSSIMYDFAILDRPMVFFAYDLPEYQNATRGFYKKYHKVVPGENIKDTQKLVSILKNLPNYQLKYNSKVDAFRERYCSYEDGNVSKRIIKKVFGGNNE